MTTTEQREAMMLELRRVSQLCKRRGIPDDFQGRRRAVAIRLERLRTLRTLLLLRHEAKTLRAARGEEMEPNRAWYIRQVSRVTWAMDGKAGR